MRIAGKFLVGIAFAAISVFGFEWWIERWQGEELKEIDLAYQERSARTLQASISRVWQTEGEEVARRIVEAVNEEAKHVMIRWVEADHVPGYDPKNPKPEIVRLVRSDGGEEMRYTWVPIGVGNGPRAALELVESMAPRQAFVRRAQMQHGVTAVVLVVLSALVALGIGTRLVERPVQQLRSYIRALGDGAVPPPIAIKGKDEIGGLADELHAMGERLAQRERLQHADRLRTVGQLASGIAHELGTPLNVIALRAQLISSGEAAGAEALTNARVIAEQAARMTAIIRQVLDYSRRESVPMGALDLRDLVARTLGLIDSFAGRQGTAMEVDSAGRSLPVQGSETKLQQVLTNILMNALQATGSGGRVRVEVGACVAEPPPRHGGAPGEYGAVVVTDSGPGIAGDDLPHIFEPFFTTKSVGEGTGLGLAVAQAIVEEHGGWMTAENAPGGGARFSIYLPLNDGKASVA